MTPFQEKLVQILRTKNFNGSLSTTELADRAKTSRLAVWAAMLSLQKQGLANYFRHGQDQWAASLWYLEQNPVDKSTNNGR